MKFKNLFFIIFPIISGCSLQYAVQEDEALYQQGRDLYAKGEYLEASESFKLICNDFDWSDRTNDSWYYLGKCYLSLAEVNENLVAPLLIPDVINAFKEVNLASDKYVGSLFETGYAYYISGDYDSSLYFNEKILNKYSGSSKGDDATLYKGHYFRKTEDYDSSIIYYENLLNHYPESNAYDNGLYWAGDYYYERKHLESNKLKAIEYFQTFISIADSADEKYSYAKIKLQYLGVIE